MSNPHHRREKVRSEQSKLAKQRWAAGEMEAQRLGMLRANTGRKMSDEHLRKLQAARRAAGCSPETREKRRLNKLGTTQSPETIAKRKATVAARGGPKPVSEETRQKLKEANRNQIVEPSQRMRISETLKEAHRRDPEVKRRHWQKVVDSNPLLQKGPQNKTAVHAVFKSPDGRTFRCRNIAHFARTHPELFLEDDVALNTRGTCRAAAGLRRLRSAFYGATEEIQNNARRSWKGWTLLE